MLHSLVNEESTDPLFTSAAKSVPIYNIGRCVSVCECVYVRALVSANVRKRARKCEHACVSTRVLVLSRILPACVG